MTDDDSDSPIQKSEAAERIRRIKANVMHLVDLKQHGYSPRYTELQVCPRTDRVLALPQRRPRPGRPKPAPIVQPLMLRKRT